MSSVLKQGWPGVVAAALAAAALCCLWAAFPGLRLAPRSSIDVAQERLEEAAGPIGLTNAVGQSFACGRSGLNAIDILLVVYNPDRVRPADATLTLTLTRRDRAMAPVVVSTPAAALTHNQRVSFTFGPLADSRGGQYAFALSAEGDDGLSCWRTTDDAYAGGAALVNGQPLPGDLYFSTRCAYGPGAAVRDLLAGLGRAAALAPGLSILLFLPGAVVLIPLRRGLARSDLPTGAAYALALSLAFWPLLLLWTTTLSMRLRGAWIWLPVAVLAALGVAGGAAVRRRGVSERDAHTAGGETSRAPYVALAIVLAIVACTRVLQVRDLVVPPWVDSVHHTVVTQVIAEQGQVPGTAEPYLQLIDYHYHFGFQANAAVLVALSGLDAPGAVLALGQVLNAASALMVYVLCVGLTKRRWAGAIAALAAGLVSNMPAYYLSWGRYTQLTGMVLLPAACLSAHWLMSDGERNRERASLNALLVAGLFVTHYRVILLYLLYLLVTVPVALVRRSRTTHDGRAGLLALAAASAGAALWVLPWSVRLLTRVLPNVGTLYAGWAAPEGYNAFPTGLLERGWSSVLLYVAAAGAVWGAVRRKSEIVLLAVWAGGWLLAANLRVLGLADTWLLSNASVAIALWLPASVLCGWLLADLAQLVGQWLRSRPAPLLARARGAATSAALVLLTAVAVWFGWGMVDIVNPVTVIAFPEDVEAIAWIGENTPPGARILVNSRLWEGDIHVGSDGGWWIPLLAQRQVTMPSILYHQGPSAYRDSVNDLAMLVEQAVSVDAPELLERLAAEGVTHVYVGVRGGRLMPKDLDGSAHYERVYAWGATRVYRFVP
ncbi:MAG: hypothetical protein GX557_05955 [Chloroflexi bacterium]|nr:hypothetical protein [Chloroflexota bacterium]